MNHYEELVKLCDHDIRTGQAQNVGRRLAKLNITRIPREWRQPLAKICRRARLLTLGLKILAKVIFPTKATSDGEARPEELAEYASLLLRAGALSEALSTLDKVNVELVPEANLYRAFCFFERADYDLAIPCLTEYLKTPLGNYARLVGQVNLAAALTWNIRFDEALELLSENIHAAELSNHRLLLANCFELRSQVLIKKGSMTQARTDIDSAMALVGSTTSASQSYIMRMNAMIAARESNSIEPLLNYRAHAESIRDWENVRTADADILEVKFDSERFEHLVFGTPRESFRNQIYKLLGTQPKASSYVFGTKGSICLDLATASISGEQALNPGKKTHQLIEVLARDFYAPWRLGGIFAELFPGERFDIYSSPDRVHQLIRRTRRWLSSHSLALEIAETHGRYSLNFTGPFSILVSLGRMTVAGHHVQIQSLRAFFDVGHAFSAREACEKLQLPKSSFQLIAAWAVSQGLMERFGTRNFTRYRLTSSAFTKIAA